MKILVTGAAGFIGSHVAEALLGEGHKVVAVDNFNDYYDPALKHYRASLLPKVQWNKIDISDYDALRLIFEREKFDKVCHLAAQAGVRYSLSHPHVYERSNALGTLNILECCRHTGVKSLVFASSSSVYGGNTKVPFSEDDRVDDPLSLYAQTKRSTELQAMVYARQFGLHCTALRFFSVYGPRGRPDMAAWVFAKNILEGKPIEIFNNGDMQRDWTFVSDIVRGIVLSLEKTSGELKGCTILNLGNNNPVKLLYFVELIEKELGKTSEKLMMPLQPGDVPLTFADISKAKNLLGWEPRISIEEGVRLFISWFKEYHAR